MRAASCFTPKPTSSPSPASASTSAPAVHQNVRRLDCVATSSMPAIASRIVAAPPASPRSQASSPRWYCRRCLISSDGNRLAGTLSRDAMRGARADRSG